MSSTRKVKLRVKNRKEEEMDFEVKESAILRSRTIKHLIEDMRAIKSISISGTTVTDIHIPIYGVEPETVDLIVKYCEKHVSGNGEYDYDNTCDDDDEDLKKWDRNFINVDMQTLFDLIEAANYLDIKSLLELGCKAVSDMMKGKSVEALRETLNIQCDFTPEEEESARKEFSWTAP